MLLVAATVLAACSDDGDNYNSNSVTVGFAGEAYSVRENARFLDIPIAIEGRRNGKVSITVSAEEIGTSPAREYGSAQGVTGNYVITDKTLNVNADDKVSRTVNVQIAPIDDDEMNEDRTFKLTIVSAVGAQITASSVTVTITDNESVLYERFAGTWILSGICGNGETESVFNRKVVIAGTSDETRPEYGSILTASGSGMINVGVDLDVSWHFRFSFDKDTKTGTLGFICGEQVASYSSSYQWIWMTDDGYGYTDADVTASWSLCDDDSLPSEIVFPESSVLYLYQPGAGWWVYLVGLKLTRQ